MPINLPAITGDVLTAAAYNSLTQFTINAVNSSDYTAVLGDAYQTLEIMSKATAIAYKIPTDASVAFEIGTCLTVLNTGVGTCTISAVTPGTTTIASAGAVSASPTLGQYKSAACLKIGANSWVVVGAIA
jgi:Tfp pilus assembly protein PilE